MPRIRLTVFIAVVLVSFLAGGRVSADPPGCGNCHDPAEFEGMDPSEVQEALADPGIPPHAKFADLSEEEVEALLEALAE